MSLVLLEQLLLMQLWLMLLLYKVPLVMVLFLKKVHTCHNALRIFAMLVLLFVVYFY